MTDYEILGIMPGATIEEVHSAYIAKIKKYHPDRIGHSVEAEEKVKRINLAYSRLKSVIPSQPCPKLHFRNDVYTVK